MTTHELGTPLLAHRIRQAVHNYVQPLNYGVLRHPLVTMFQSIVDHTSDWIIVKDLEHRFLFATNAFVEAVGLPVGQLIGKNDLEIGSSEEDVYGNPATGWKGFWAQDDEVAQSGIPTAEDNPNWRVFSSGSTAQAHIAYSTEKSGRTSVCTAGLRAGHHRAETE